MRELWMDVEAVNERVSHRMRSIFAHLTYEAEYRVRLCFVNQGDNPSNSLSSGAAEKRPAQSS